MRNNSALCSRHLLVDDVLLAQLVVNLLSRTRDGHSKGVDYVGRIRGPIAGAYGRRGHDFNYILNKL